MNNVMLFEGGNLDGMLSLVIVQNCIEGQPLWVVGYLEKGSITVHSNVEEFYRKGQVQHLVRNQIMVGEFYLDIKRWGVGFPTEDVMHEPLEQLAPGVLLLENK